MSKVNKKIVIGMTGRRDSTVAAYLLKKQGYDCIGVGLVLNDEKLAANAVKHGEKRALEAEEFNLNDSYLENKKAPKEPLYSRCHLKDLEGTKKICDHLEIPFYGVKAMEHFKSNVLDFVVGSRLSGTSFQPCINCNQVKLEILMEKGKMLGADHIATGHYAKILKNQTTGYYNIAKSNDLENDQSYLLSRTGQDILSNLILPLSDMRTDEVQKLLELIGIKTSESSEGTQMCYSRDPRLINLVEYCAADSLIKKGHLSIIAEDTILADHNGIHNFYIGQSKLKLSGEKKIDPGLHVIDIKHSTGTVYLAPVDELVFTHCQVQKLQHDSKMDTTKPAELFAKVGSLKTLLPCIVYFQNNRAALIEFNKPQSGLLSKGLVIAFYNKESAGGRLLCSGFISSSGVIEGNKILSYVPPEPEYIDEEEAKLKEKEKQKNALPDFYF